MIFIIILTRLLCHAAALSGTDSRSISRTLDEFTVNPDRVIEFCAGKKRGVLLISKHENSTAYNTNIEYITALEKKGQPYNRCKFRQPQILHRRYKLAVGYIL